MRRAPAFWRHDGAAARFLAPLAGLYGAIAARQLRRDAPLAPLPCIVVGGLTAGGDGKTPLVMALADMLAAMGERPALLTRGYGARTGGAPLVATEADSVDRTGDEAPLLARHGLTVAGADRVASASLARAMGATALILDDGFHSRRLTPDLTLLAVDAHYGAGNGRCLPAGPLRAPLQAQFAATDALVLIGDGAEGPALTEGSAKPVFRATATGAGERFAGRRVVAFAGIGRPEKFFRTVTEAGADIAAARAFADHHRYTAADIAALSALARRNGAALVTTEKDALRLPRDLGVETLPIRLDFADPSAVVAAVTAALARARLSRAS